MLKLRVLRVVQGTQQTQHAFGEMDVQDDLDDINLDQLVSSWQARRAQPPAPASMRHQGDPPQPPSNSTWQGPSSRQPPCTTGTGIQNRNFYAPGHSIGALVARPPAAAAAATTAAASGSNALPCTQNAAGMSGSMQGAGIWQTSPFCAGGGIDQSNAAAAPTRAGAGSMSLADVSGPGSTQTQTGLDPALQGRCCHGAPLGRCHQGGRHLADLKDSLLKV